MKGGWIGITHNEAKLHVNTKIVNSITKVKENLKEISNMTKRKHKHVECSPSRMVKDEMAVESLMKAFREWNSNPWNTEIPALRSLESGLLASDKLAEDFNIAKEDGKKQATQFLKERLLSNKKQIYSMIE